MTRDVYLHIIESFVRLAPFLSYKKAASVITHQDVLKYSRSLATSIFTGLNITHNVFIVAKYDRLNHKRDVEREKIGRAHV